MLIRLEKGESRSSAAKVIHISHFPEERPTAIALPVETKWPVFIGVIVLVFQNPFMFSQGYSPEIMSPG
jgi:hypothetical protein